MENDTSVNISLKKSVFANALLATLEIVGIIISFAEYGIAQYRFFTEDINLFACIISMIYCVYGVRAMKAGGKIPKVLYLLRSIAAINLVMVFCVCLTGGITGYDGKTFCHIMLTNASLFFHTICPVLSVFMALFIEVPGIRTSRKCLLALGPPIIYSLIIIPMNILRLVHGPYTYLCVYDVSVGTVVGAVIFIHSLTFAISVIYVLLRRRLQRRKNESCYS